MLFQQILNGISIHALREEGDRIRHWCCRFWERFLSTPSARRATLAIGDGFVYLMISIHALREEGDAPGRRWKSSKEISIHALREEGDNSNLIVERVA